jgi:uncharacterized membrane protein
MKRLKVCLKLLVLAVIGGAIYVGIEMLWRGHSHPSMFILGGLCFVSIGLINELFPWELGIVWQALIGGTMVTCLEFITGVIVNIWLKLGVWDYSGLPLNILGKSVYRSILRGLAYLSWQSCLTIIFVIGFSAKRSRITRLSDYKTMLLSRRWFA